MSIGQIILIAIAANLDNIGVGIAYGTRRVGLCFTKNLIIAAIAFLVTAFCGYLGYYTTKVISVHWAKIIGANMLIGVGIWVGASNYERKRSRFRGWYGSILKAKEAYLRCNCGLTWGETVFLGVALAINSMVGGFIAGVQGGNILLVSGAIAIFSYVFILLGLHLGETYAAKFLGEKSGLLAGILLIFIGIYQALT